MRLVRKIFAKNRVRDAKKRLSLCPTPQGYADLAREHAMCGNSLEVIRTCEEGLALFPGNATLIGLFDRARRLGQEARLVELRRELEISPRPALYREMCEILIESGRLSRAEEVAQEWQAKEPQGESVLMQARVHVERFLADRGREQGQRALALLELAVDTLPEDTRPWRLRLKLLTKIGAFGEACGCAEHLLKLAPGDPKLEARYRALEAKSVGAPDVTQALLVVERTGRLAGEEPETAKAKTRRSEVRPILRDLASLPNVKAAVYLRGGTALVQGPKGATAERTARAVRSVLSTGRTAGRRLGLGHLFHIRLEGDFGSLSIAPGEMDSAALWGSQVLNAEGERSLMSLVGLNADTGVEAGE